MSKSLVACATLFLGCHDEGTRARAELARDLHGGAARTASPALTATVPSSDAPPGGGPWPPPPPAGVRSDFCIEVVRALDADTCYVLPDAPTRELLLYLHGIVPPDETSTQKTNFETVVANASRRAGVAALLPRGRLGLAPKGHDRWWGWPTTGPAYAKFAQELILEFGAKRRKLEALTGRPFVRVYVAGSSSGAYFATALALNGGISADGFGAISGGASRGDAVPQTVPPKPFYIGYGTRDAAGGAARLLASRLFEAGWPVKVAAHPLPHGAAEVYLDEAFAFWREPAP